MASEQTELLITASSDSIEKRHSKLDAVRRRYSTFSVCLNSKAGLLILLWSAVIFTAYQLISQPENYTYLVPAKYLSFIYAGNAFILLFYPLSGFLADNKFGRYNTVIWSLYVILILFGVSYLALAVLLSVFSATRTYFIIATLFFVPLTISFLLFKGNVIQFGMDQLQEFPADHQSLFIHWYMWVYFLSICISQTGSKYAFFSEKLFSYVGVCLLAVISFISIALLVISIWVRCRRKNWFLVDTARLNPYKTVYRITKFARTHTVPIYRSAFTYCEDELPSGLDLGKEKYGGPFTTEQVEDVKSFFGILKVMLALTPAFFVNVATDAVLTSYAEHIRNSRILNDSAKGVLETLFIYNGLLSSVLVVVLIPLYLIFLRPIVYHYVPSMLKRMGLGMVVMVLSLICTFVMDAAAHTQDRSVVACMLDTGDRTLVETHQDPLIIIIQRTMAAISNMLIFIALYEFICSQSPHAMKGLLIGLSFAARGFCDMLSSFVIIPFSYIRIAYPSCGMLYIAMNILVAVAGLLVYVIVAKRYKFRVRDEICDVYRYAEEYYSKSGSN